MPGNHFQLDSIPYPVVIIDRSGLIVQVNQQAIVFTGKQEKNLLNTPVHDAFHPAGLSEENCPLCDYIKHRNGEALHNINYKERGIWQRVSFSPVSIDNEGDGLLQMAVDITEYVSLEKKNSDQEISIHAMLKKMPVIYYRIDKHELIQEIIGEALSKLDLDVGIEGQVTVRATDLFKELKGKYDSIIQHGRYFFESQHSTKQGEAWFFHYIFLAPENGELTGFALDVTSMKLAQRAMLKLSVDKRNLARRMLQMQEDVRYEVARELHDEIGQSITAVRVIASAMLGAQEIAPYFYRQSAESISDVAAKMYESAHALMYSLRPIVLDTLGLESAIQSCIHASGLSQVGVDINLDIEGEVETMDQLVQLTLFRIVQEALTNIAKYANASTVNIKISRNKIFDESVCYSDLLELKISDDGVGFSADQQQNKCGMGIPNLRERVHALCGILNISSRPGEGVTLFVRINLKMAELDSK